jgi:hypothetical protein
MNCTDFANIVVALARDEALDATLKQRGTQHAQSCVRCAGRLKTEQGLSRNLRAVAKGDQLLSAPTSLETTLLAAFRAQTEAAPIAANVLTPTFREAPLQRWFAQLKWMLLPATAVAVLVLIAFAVTRLMPTTTTTEPTQATATVTPVPSATVESPAPEQVKAPMPSTEDAPRELAMQTNTRRLTPVKAQATAIPLRRRGNVTVEVGEFFVDEPEAISANEFLVFDYAQNLPPADSSQLMRVRMPRERLAPLGIPLPRETRNDNFVNADLLVGSDGVPRAIRVANR